MNSTDNNNEAYSRITWNAASYVGMSSYIKIVDSAAEDFGHLNVDDVTLK